MKRNKIVLGALLTLVATLFLSSCGDKEKEIQNISLANTTWYAHVQKETQIYNSTYLLYVDSDLQFTSDNEGTIFIDYFLDKKNSNYSTGDTISSSFTYTFDQKGNGTLKGVNLNPGTNDFPAVYNEAEQTVTVTITSPSLKTYGITELTFKPA